MTEPITIEQMQRVAEAYRDENPSEMSYSQCLAIRQAWREVITPDAVLRLLADNARLRAALESSANALEQVVKMFIHSHPDLGPSKDQQRPVSALVGVAIKEICLALNPPTNKGT